MLIFQGVYTTLGYIGGNYHVCYPLILAYINVVITICYPHRFFWRYRRVPRIAPTPRNVANHGASCQGQVTTPMTCTMAEKRGKEKAGKIKMIASLPTETAAVMEVQGIFVGNVPKKVYT